jgi:hypothetical protein
MRAYTTPTATLPLKRTLIPRPSRRPRDMACRAVPRRDWVVDDRAAGRGMRRCEALHTRVRSRPRLPRTLLRFRGHAQNRSVPVQDVGCMGLMLVSLAVVASVKPAGAGRADPHVFFEAGHVAASRAALARTLFFL